MTATRGLLIILEGCDRTGKSTQAKLLCEQYVAQGKRAELIKFPDRTTPIGRVLNEYLQRGGMQDAHAAHLLFSANRWELYESIR